jgi:hypothetical protein
METWRVGGSVRTLITGAVESSLSIRLGMAYGAKNLVEEMQSRSLSFRSWAVIR